MKFKTTASFACILYVMLQCITFYSCSSSKTTGANFLYFQNAGDSMPAYKVKERVVKEGDVLGIQVASQSLNQDQVIVFNPTNNNATGKGNVVTTAGTIDLPVIGTVKVTGLTINQLQQFLVDKLAVYIKDPSVTVHFLQFKVDILGEVKNPGTQNFTDDHVSVVDALSAAGDLTDNAKRTDILVVRQDSTKRKFYKIDLTNTNAFLSPAYQLQPGDVVYAGATAKKIATVNRSDHEGQKIWTFILTTLSVLTTTVFIIVTATK